MRPFLINRLLFASLFILAGYSTPAQIITTVAGNGRRAFSGDGGPADSASLDWLLCAAVDDTGSIYTTDYNSYRLRKVDTFGIITTIAGSRYGYSGDGGPASTARMGTIYDIAIDKAGNIYLADGEHGHIRKINTAGIISNFAGNGVSYVDSGDGGPATLAGFSGISSIALDDTGNLFVSGGYRVRKINTAGIVTTVAGNGIHAYTGDGGRATAVSINGAGPIATDHNGNFYIIDDGLHLRKVDTAGIIHTITGGGAGFIRDSTGFRGDGGSAVNAVFYDIIGIAIDHQNNIFLSDGGNNHIRKIDSNGIITSVVGIDTTCGFSGDGGPADSAHLCLPFKITVDKYNNLYICDVNNNRIRKVTDRARVVSGIFNTSPPQSRTAAFPNPTFAMVNISELLSTDQLALYDITGRPLHFISSVPHNGTNQFDISSLPPGFYIIVVTGQNGIIKNRIKMEKI